MRGGKDLGKIVRRKRRNETRGITAKEISSVNGDNPYPGSNDDGMDAGDGGAAGEGRKKGTARGGGIVRREELPLAGFPQEVL